MNKKVWVIISLVILIIILFLFFIITYQNRLSPVTANIVKCNTIQENGEDKTSLVFLSDKVFAEKYTNELLSFSPFDKNKDEFNIYYITPEDYNPDCQLYKGIALLCNSKENIKAASSCPNDYIIVVKSEQSNIRSSAYTNVISINSNLPSSVMAHEFGHAFANFAEEYTPASIPLGSENCQSKCNNFDKPDSCFQGCSKDNYFRSINAGIMRTLNSNTFGSYNEEIISEKIQKKSDPNANTNLQLTGNAIQDNPSYCEEKNYYLISGIYNQETNSIQIIEKTLETGCIGNGGSGIFTYQLTNSNNEEIFSEEFSPELIFTDGNPLSETSEEISGETFQSDQTFYLKLPVISNTNNLEILKENQSLVEISLNEIGYEACRI